MTPTLPADGPAADVLARLSTEFADIAQRMTAVSGDMTELKSLLTATTDAAPQPRLTDPQSAPHTPQAPAAGTGFVPPTVAASTTPPSTTAAPTAAPSPVPHAPQVPVTPLPYPPGMSRPATGSHTQAAQARSAGVPTPQFPPFATPFGQSPYGPATYRPAAQLPYPSTVGVPRPQYPPPPKRPLSERIAAASERGLIGKVLAAVGVGITLIGVVLLLVLAAQAGLLRPELRVAGGAVLAAALAGAGVYLGRNHHKRAGAIALVATGIAAALFDVLAATVIYRWLPDYAALIVAAVIAGGGFVVAHRWNSQALGLMVGLPLIAFAPFLAGGTATLAGFLIAYAAATMWVQVGRNWTAMFAVNTAVATLPTLSFLREDAMYGTGGSWFYVVAALVNALLALGFGVVLLRSTTRPTVITLIAAAASLPVLAASAAVDGRAVAGMLILMTVAFAVLAFAGGALPGVTRTVRIIWLAAAAVTVLGALGSALQAFGWLLGLASVALVVTAAAAGMRYQDGDADEHPLRVPMQIIATAFTALATASTLVTVPQIVLIVTFGTTTQIQLLLVALLALVAVALLVWTGMQGRSASGMQVVGTMGALAGLWLATTMCVGLGALISGGTDGGLRGGHAAATIIWALTAAIGLMWARGQRGSTRALSMTVSLAIMTAAVAKLFLYDMSALDGVFRVIAFIVVGLLLLSLGVAYAQSLSSDQRDGQTPAHP